MQKDLNHSGGKSQGIRNLIEIGKFASILKTNNTENKTINTENTINKNMNIDSLQYLYDNIEMMLIHRIHHADTNIIN